MPFIRSAVIFKSDFSFERNFPTISNVRSYWITNKKRSEKQIWIAFFVQRIDIASCHLPATAKIGSNKLNFHRAIKYNETISKRRTKKMAFFKGIVHFTGMAFMMVEMYKSIYGRHISFCCQWLLSMLFNYVTTSKHTTRTRLS